MKIWTGLALSSVLLICNTAVSHANAGSWEYGGRLSGVSIDEDTAREQGIEDSAYLLGLHADYVENGWVTSLGLDVIIYDDNEEFTQTVEGTGFYNDGDISVESSDANAAMASVAVGYQWRFGEDQQTALRAQIGYAGVFSSERRITNCSDCFSEDIDVDGGGFISVNVEREMGAVSVGLYAQQFLGGDGVSSIFGIRISSGF